MYLVGKGEGSSFGRSKRILEDNNGSYLKKTGHEGLDSTGSGKCPVAGFCVDLSRSIKGSDFSAGVNFSNGCQILL